MTGKDMKKKKTSIKRSLLLAMGILLIAAAVDLFLFGVAGTWKKSQPEYAEEIIEKSAESADAEREESRPAEEGQEKSEEEAAIAEGDAETDADTEAEKRTLTGIRMLGIGDSLLCGHLEGNAASWFDALGRKYGMVYYNFAVSGDTIAYSDRAKAEHAATSMVRRQEAIIEKAGQVDLVIIEGGTNDQGDDIPIGEDSDYEDTSFKGALNIMIDRFQAAYPDALIVCMTPYRWTNGETNALGLTYSDYSRAMKEICSLQGVPCFENERGCLVDFGDEAYLQWADEGLSLGFDNINRHFNMKAQEKLQTVYEEYLEEKVSEWQQEKGQAETKAAAEKDGKVTEAVAEKEENLTEENRAEGENTEDPLKGKSLLVIGDGILNGHSLGEGFSWVSDLAISHQMTCYNFAVNKAAIAYSDAALADKSIAMSRQCQKVLDAVPSADIVLIEGGMNDRNENIPIGDLSDQGDETFLGGLNSLIDVYQQAYPQAKIICMTPYHRNDSFNALGLCDRDYAEAMLRLCESRGISCYDNYSMAEVDFMNSDYESWADEGLYLGREANQHFSPAANAALFSIYENWLTNLYAEVQP